MRPLALVRLAALARRWVLALALLLCPALAAGGVTLVLSQAQGGYAEAGAAFQQELQRLGVRTPVTVLERPQFQAQGANGSQLLVVVGLPALETALAQEPRLPVLALLVSRPAFERLVAARGGGRRVSAVFLDQPLARQLDLIRLTLPEVGRLAVLTGPDSRDWGERLTALAGERRLRLQQAEVSAEPDIYRALEQVLHGAGALLALPDRVVSNPGTIQNLLLTAYRHKVPVVGFSQAYVRAGALLAVHSSPAQIGTQGAELARHFLAQGQLPLAQHPRYFAVSINHHVARSLGLSLEPETVLLERLMRQEREP